MKRNQRGMVVRVSEDLEQALKKRRRKRESYDALLRRCLGLPDKKGKPQSPYQILHTYWAIHNEGAPMVFMSQADAKGAAIQLAVKNKLGRIPRVFRVTEVL